MAPALRANDLSDSGSQMFIGNPTGIVNLVSFRAEGALTFECQRRTRSTWIFVCSRARGFSGISETDRCWWAAKECVHVAPDATIGSGVAPRIVWKVLIVIDRVTRGFTGRN